MKIICTSDTYRIYSNDIKTYDKLPAKTFNIRFAMQQGFFLVEIPNIKVNEKVYGIHQQKLKKVVNAFEKNERNLGVILSGDKGIGKSLFAKMLVEEGINLGFPVIIVDTYYPGIASFIASIEQEAFVLFDEFDKTFSGKQEEDGTAYDPQTEMLSLFDGTSQGKKLFIVTCNELRNLNGFMVNRPGRFHYHFRFDYPDASSIREYLTDKSIDNDNIEKVISFSCKVPLNYDCLRAIAAELMFENNFEDAIKDLNIVNIKNESYDIIVVFTDGSRAKGEANIDMFNNDEIKINIGIRDRGWIELGDLTFCPANANYDVTIGGYCLKNKDCTWEFDTDVTDPDPDYGDGYMKKMHSWAEKKFDYAIIRHQISKNFHYTV